MHRLALAGLVPALFAAPGGAQTAPVITEAEFLSVLDESHPAVAEGAEDLGIARAQRLDASTLENPTLGVVREDPSGAVRQTDWTLSWQLPEAARRAQIEAHDQAVVAAEARLSQRLMTLRLTMREAYAEWAVAVARQERLTAQAERVDALALREAARAERGETSSLEAHRLELAAVSLRSRAALSAAAAEAAWAAAAVWNPAIPTNARPTLPVLPPPPDLADFHPSVAAAEADLAEVTLEREAAGRLIGSPEVTVGWQRQEVGPEEATGAIVGLAWSVPLLDRNRAEKAASDSRISAAQARLERVRREVSAARPAARAAYETLAAALENAEAQLAVSGRALDGAEAAFRHGETTLTDLLDTHRSVGEAELALLDLYERALATHRELHRLAASGSPADLPNQSLSSEPMP